MRVSATGEKYFWQRNDRSSRWTRRRQPAELARSWGQHVRIAEHLLQAQRRRTRKDELVVRITERIIGGILGESTAVIGLRTEVTRRCKCIEREVLASSALQR